MTSPEAGAPGILPSFTSSSSKIQSGAQSSYPSSTKQRSNAHTLRHRTGIGISAIDINRNKTHAILAGKDILKTVFTIDFIYEGYRYKFTATRASLDSYHLFINGSRCTVGVRALSDGGLLILLDGHSHKEMRLVVPEIRIAPSLLSNGSRKDKRTEQREIIVRLSPQHPPILSTPRQSQTRTRSTEIPCHQSLHPRLRLHSPCPLQCNACCCTKLLPLPFYRTRCHAVRPRSLLPLPLLLAAIVLRAQCHPPRLSPNHKIRRSSTPQGHRKPATH